MAHWSSLLSAARVSASGGIATCVVGEFLRSPEALERASPHEIDEAGPAARNAVALRAVCREETGAVHLLICDRQDH